MAKALLRPSAVARLANLKLRAQAVVEGFLTGLHQSPYHGFSVEFAQHRPYMPGDSLKHLDYKVLSRTGRYYIKQFEEETNLKAYLLVDHSGSMGFQYKGVSDDIYSKSKSGISKFLSNNPIDEGLSKLDYAVCLAAALSLLLLRQRDAVGLITFAENITSILQPHSAMGWFEPLTKELSTINPTGKTTVASALFEIAERVKRRGLVVLISDLLDDQERILAAMRAIRHIGHELIVFQILNPLEISFTFPRDARFKDLETADILPTRPWHIRYAYQKEMQKFIERYRDECRAARIDYRLFTTDIPYEIALFEFLVRRKRLY